MLFIKTIGLWRLRKKIAVAKSDVERLSATKPEDSRYKLHQQLLPLVKADLVTWEKELTESSAAS